MNFFLGSLTDTQRLAETIAKHVRPRDMIVLSGEMGTGKTTFTQYFGRALGVTELITSPTFNLLHNYGTGRVALHHADLYRLERTGELADLGLNDLQDSGGVIAVEWGDIVGDELGEALVLHFRYMQTADGHEESNDVDQRRNVKISSRGAQWQTRLQKLLEDLAVVFEVSPRG